MLNFLKLLILVANKRAQNNAGRYLIDNKKTIATAESCTGGLVSSLLTDVSCSSSYIGCNFVTYANEAKIKYLNVKKETLETYGAVSLQTAQEMVEGLLNTTNSDYAIATTGIAGPSGGTTQKPVGLVYIGIGSKEEVKIYKYNVNPKYPRVLIKYMFAQKALKLFNEFVGGKK